MTAIAHELKLMGTVVTAWLPQRYPPGVFPMPWRTPHISCKTPCPSPLPDAMARFTSSYFGSRIRRSLPFVRLAGIESSRADLLATFWSDSASFAVRLTPENRARDVIVPDSNVGNR
jgi:hypothetical protein